MEPLDPLVRATAALRALAVGDAMGRATEYYDPAEITEVYEDLVTELFEPVRLFDEEEWAAGEIGPPTEQVIALSTEGESAAATSGPRGDTADALSAGVALGLARPLGAVLAGEASAAAVAAVAAAVGAAMEGYAGREVVGFASQAARVAGDDALAEAIMAAAGIAQASGGRHPGEALRAVFPPVGDAAAVTPFILGLVYGTQSARRAILEAVNQGGHAPETAGIAGAICAGISPTSLPEAWGADVERRNGLDLTAVAHRYLAARARAGG